MKSKRETIAENITYLRKKNGLSQNELAHAVGYSDKAISKWEHAESMPDVDSLYALSEIFNVSIDYFFHEDDAVKAKYIKENRDVRIKQSLILSLIVVACMGIALVVFLTGIIRNWENKNSLWISFVYAAAISDAIIFLFFRRTHNGLGKVIASSIFIWFFLTSAFLTTILINENMWAIFLLGIPLQAAIILIYFIKKR